MYLQDCPWLTEGLINIWRKILGWDIYWYAFFSRVCCDSWLCARAWIWTEAWRSHRVETRTSQAECILNAWNDHDYFYCRWSAQIVICLRFPKFPRTVGFIKKTPRKPCQSSIAGILAQLSSNVTSLHIHSPPTPPTMHPPPPPPPLHTHVHTQRLEEVVQVKSA